ncbi:MAG: amidohydrolase family protein [Dehalococcoidia bacterium]
MSSEELERPVETRGIGPGIVDCDIHPAPKNGGETLKPYIARQWQEHMDTFGDPHNGPYASAYGFPRYMPATARRDAWPDDGGLPGSNLETMRAQHLDRNDVALGILEPLGFGNSARNLEYGAALCAAVNEWQVDEFVDKEPRLRASIVVMMEDAPAAVEQIRRHAPDQRFAQVQMPSLTAEPLGRRRYWPIFEEAASHGLPIGIHVGGPTGARTAGGWPAYYNEEHLSLVSTLQTHMISLVMEGVCEQFPNLKFILIEGGVVWSISLRKRLDRLWGVLRSEVPHVRMAPSEYIARNFYFSTQPVEEPENPSDLPALFEQVGWDRILYSSDYPHWDYDDPKYAFKCEMPDEGMKKLMRSNALDLYRLDRTTNHTSKDLP